MIPHQRLRFAAARGARIEGFIPIIGAWTLVDDFPPPPHGTYRIHPDDAHLEYGSLSSALREGPNEASLLNRRLRYAAWEAVIALFPSILEGMVPGGTDEDNWALLECLVAELLADEGM